MPRYKVDTDGYQSYRDGKRYGWWPKGQVVDLTEEEAEWVNRDSPGTLSPERPAKTAKAEPGPEPDDAEPAEPAEAEPPRKRQPARNRQHRPSQDRSS